MQPRYITAKSSGILAANWTPLDWWRIPCHIGLSVFDPNNAGWSINVTMDDPTGAFPNPNPALNPSLRAGGQAGLGANVQTFLSSQVGGWSSGPTGTGFCFGSTSGPAMGGISQPIAAIQFTSTANVAVGTTSSGVPVLTILQAGIR